MRIQRDQKSKSEDIVKKFINETAKKTNDELKKYLDELRKLKKETTSIPK